MQLSWLESLIYGFISGLTELLPVSSQAHQAILNKVFGVESAGALMSLLIHLAVLLALIFSCRPQLERLRLSQQLAKIPKRRRRRQPDPVAILDMRLLKTAAIPILICFLLYIQTNQALGKLNICAAFLIVNGLFLYIPQFLTGANKDSRSMSGLDSLLIGLSGALGILPGISRMGTILSVSMIRGADRKCALHWALMLSIPSLAALMVLDLVNLFTMGIGTISFAAFLPCLLAAITAYLGAWAAIASMRFLSINASFSGFAYYSWGAALLSFILYLTI